MIIGADVSHAAPGIGAPSYAAMTVSMDRHACRYAAGVQTNGYRVEMISTRNLRDMLKPLFQHWMETVSGGNLPAHVYYFRDGVSEGQYLNVLKYEVADIKEIFKEIQGDTRPGFEVSGIHKIQWLSADDIRCNSQSLWRRSVTTFASFPAEQVTRTKTRSRVLSSIAM